MSVPTNKTELQNAIDTNYSKLRIELRTIPAESAEEKNMDGHAKGTQMSVNNLVSYLIGWGELVINWIEKKDRNEPVDFPATGYKWNELGKLAGKFYDDYQDQTYPDLCRQLDETVSRILQIIELKSNAELYEVAWYEKWTLGRMIQFNTSSPYSNARTRIRKWKKK